MFGSYSLVILRKLNILSLYEQDCLQCHALACINMEMNLAVGWSRSPVDIFGTVVGESPDCLLLSGSVVGENPDHVYWEVFYWSSRISDIIKQGMGGIIMTLKL